MRLLIRLLGAFVVLIVVVLALALFSARSSLDGEYEHTRRTEALPAFSPDVSAGLVAISARGMVFRARVAGLEG